jgi:hypothetical protein
MSERMTDEQLRDLRDCNPANPFIAPMAAELLALRARLMDLEAALEDFVKWSEAYPTSIFVEPDYAEAMRAKCEEIARNRLKVDPDCWTIVRDIAALK